MNRIIVLNIEFEITRKEIIHPVILQDDRETILVDCGYPSLLDKIIEDAHKHQIELSQLTKIIITHQDYDHMGTLSEIKQQYPHIQILASETESRYISGQEKFIRLQRLEEAPDQVLDRHLMRFRLVYDLYGPLKTAQVDYKLKNYEILPYCGELEIIPTPGHMPGHISIYSKALKTLIPGDALVLRHDELQLAEPSFTMDIDMAKRSLIQFLDYDIETIICYHGGIYNRDIKQSIRKIIES